MTKGGIVQAWTYHNATKHSWRSIRENAHFLDWQNQPRAFKIYAALERIALPEVRRSGSAALRAIAAPAVEAKPEALLDLPALASLLHFTGGITRRRRYPGGEILFRAASCTGALYEFEIYVVCSDLPGLPAGLYHYSPVDHALRALRSGDYRGLLVRATAGEPAVKQAPASLIFTGTYWRNAWKYQARTYRHFGWDSGTMLANLLAESAALGLPARVVMGFLDHELNRLLDLDSEREVAFSLVPLGQTDSAPAPTAAPSDLPRLDLETVPLSRSEVDYPLMRQAHAASAFHSPEDVAAWQHARLPARPVASGERTSGDLVPLRPLSDENAPQDSIEDVILRRGSTRTFARVPIGFAQFSTILDRAARGFPADFHDAPGTLWNDLYLIVHAVEGIEPGAYYYRPDLAALAPLKLGDFRDTAGRLGLEQDIPADCSAAVFFLAGLDPIFEQYGARGYRAVQTEAGILGGRLYLGAYAQRLGASGLTFYDDEVTEFFSPHARGKSAIFLVALGKRAAR